VNTHNNQISNSLDAYSPEDGTSPSSPGWNFLEDSYPARFLINKRQEETDE